MKTRPVFPETTEHTSTYPYNYSPIPTWVKQLPPITFTLLQVHPQHRNDYSHNRPIGPHHISPVHAAVWATRAWHLTTSHFKPDATITVTPRHLWLENGHLITLSLLDRLHIVNVDHAKREVTIADSIFTRDPSCI